ncbi:MAG: superoxide dismutase [Actinomycetota bacterium]|jgi:Fe-Mn family superoxide dismutase
MHTPFSLPELSFDPAVLAPFLDPSTIEIHHSRHHRAYVQGANETYEKIVEARNKSQYSQLMKLEKDFAFHHAGHVLHSLMWRHMGAPSETKLSDTLSRHIAASFGNLDTFVAEVSITASQIQGSGWVLACWDPVGHHIMLQAINNHELGFSPMMQPFIAVDVWEHAYYLQFHNKRADYVDAFMKVLQWESISEHFAEIMSTK